TATGDATPTQANATAADGAPQTSSDATVSVETAAPAVQIDARAHAELTATTTIDPTKPADKPRSDQGIASSEARPIPARRNTGAAPEQAAPTQAPKPEAQTDRRVEANARAEDQPNKPIEADARPTQRNSHEPTAVASTHAQAATTSLDQLQPTGFGLSQTTT